MSDSRYKGYNPDWGKKATMKYKKEKQQRIEVCWKKTDYTEHIEPAIQESGLPVATFIKQAVDEKIERMHEEPNSELEGGRSGELSRPF